MCSEVHVWGISEKGIRCLECLIALDGFEYTGFGRNEEEATGNAIKGLFELIVSKDYRTEEVKQSLKFIHRKRPQEETLDLTELELQHSISNISMIQKEQPENTGSYACGCSSWELVEQQNKKISNLEARLKLLAQENSILKELLLK